MAGDQNLHEILADTTTIEPHEQTFLGSIDFSTRVVLYALFGLAALVVAGGVFYFADQELSAAQRETASARELARLTARVEKSIWQIRSDERDFLLGRNPRAAERYKRGAAALTDVLGALYARPDTVLASDHITTLDEGLAQYTAEFNKVVEAKTAPGPGETAALARLVAKSGRNLEARVERSRVASLKDVVTRMRRNEKDFMRQGATKDLARVNERSEELGLMIGSAALPEQEKSQIRNLLKSYQADLTAYARAKMPQKIGTSRLDDIFTYMVPSVDGLAALAADRLAAAADGEAEARTFARWLVSVGSGVILGLLTLIGVILVRSIAAPVQALAQAATRLADGDTSVPVPALGNGDETGQLARFLTVFRSHLTEIARLRTQVADLQADLERRESAPDEGAGAGEREAAGDAGLPVPRVSAPDAAVPGLREGGVPSQSMLSGPISAISRQVAESSQSVSTAAYEAERTGTLIRGLTEAARKVGEVEALVATIGEQVNLLAFKPAGAESLSDEANKHLVVLSAGYKHAADQRVAADAVVRRRLDAIRTTAGEASRAIKGIADAITEVKGVAMDIAASTSAEALAVTQALLAQSECLRGMLDELSANIEGTTGESPPAGANVHEMGQSRPPSA